MSKQNQTAQLALEIRQIYQSDKSRAGVMIETLLEKKMTGLTPDDRSKLIKKLQDEFNGDRALSSPDSAMEEEILSKVFSLLLGREVSQAEFLSAEILQRLAESLNTIFDALNQLVSVINMTLFGESAGNETIRYVIGSHLKGENQTKSLEGYLGQIQKAFLTTQQAFKNAALARVEEILDELDPNKISEAGVGGIKFGPLRKAEYFEIYESKFRSCKKWFESGRFMDAFLREFEKNCLKLSEQ